MYALRLQNFLVQFLHTGETVPKSSRNFGCTETWTKHTNKNKDTNRHWPSELRFVSRHQGEQERQVDASCIAMSVTHCSFQELTCHSSIWVQSWERERERESKQWVAWGRQNSALAALQVICHKCWDDICNVVRKEYDQCMRLIPATHMPSEFYLWSVAEKKSWKETLSDCSSKYNTVWHVRQECKQYTAKATSYSHLHFFYYFFFQSMAEQ